MSHPLSLIMRASGGEAFTLFLPMGVHLLAPNPCWRCAWTIIDRMAVFGYYNHDLTSLLAFKYKLCLHLEAYPGLEVCLFFESALFLEPFLRLLWSWNLFGLCHCGSGISLLSPEDSCISAFCCHPSSSNLLHSLMVGRILVWDNPELQNEERQTLPNPSNPPSQAGKKPVGRPIKRISPFRFSNRGPYEHQGKENPLQKDSGYAVAF